MSSTSTQAQAQATSKRSPKAKTETTYGPRTHNPLEPGSAKNQRVNSTRKDTDGECRVQVNFLGSVADRLNMQDNKTEYLYSLIRADIEGRVLPST